MPWRVPCSSKMAGNRLATECTRAGTHPGIALTIERKGGRRERLGRPEHAKSNRRLAGAARGILWVLCLGSSRFAEVGPATRLFFRMDSDSLATAIQDELNEPGFLPATSGGSGCECGLQDWSDFLRCCLRIERAGVRTTLRCCASLRRSIVTIAGVAVPFFRG